MVFLTSQVFKGQSAAREERRQVSAVDCSAATQRLSHHAGGR